MLRKVLAAVVVCLVTLGGTILATTTSVGASSHRPTAPRATATVTLQATPTTTAGKYDLTAIVKWSNFPSSVNRVSVWLVQNARTVDQVEPPLLGNLGTSGTATIPYNIQGQRGQSYTARADVAVVDANYNPIFHVSASSGLVRLR